jgi:hydroxymethylbilane synthase
MSRRPLKIGTRGSQLALWQANWVKGELEKACPACTVELAVIKTRGDKILDVPLAKVGGKGLFVKEIEEALLAGDVDVAVHSMKDMPADLPTGLVIGPVPEREDPADVLISRSFRSIAGLPHGARVGTSSLRRKAQLLRLRPDLEIVSLRGNLDTRMRKLEGDDMDAIILAAAGVRRLGLAASITERIDTEAVVPAVAQGALCIELRENDSEVWDALSILDHPQTRTAVLGERSFLRHVGGSCQVPVAGLGIVRGDDICLTGLVSELDGSVVYRNTVSGPVSAAEEIGRKLAEDLLSRGAAQVLENLTMEANQHE